MVFFVFSLVTDKETVLLLTMFVIGNDSDVNEATEVRSRPEMLHELQKNAVYERILCKHREKTVTNRIFFVHHSNVCVKLVFWTSMEQSLARLTWSERWGDLLDGV